MKTYTRSFAGGEVAPLLYGRIDLAKFQTGLAKCLNFIVTPQGPAENRPGFQYVLQAKALGAVLIPFTYNDEQSFAIEVGDGYMRFHTQGATLLRAAQNITGITQAAPGVLTYSGTDPANGEWVYLSGIGGMTGLNGRYAVVTNRDTVANTFELYDLFGDPIDTTSLAAYTSGGTMARVYEITSPYAAADLYDLHYVQSADVLTIVHTGYAARELRRLGATNWQLSAIDFEPQIDAPGTPSASAYVGSGGAGTPEDHVYVTTAVANETLEESLPSPAVTVENDLSVAGNYNEVTPATVSGAARYNVYKRVAGVYGYVGQSSGLVFKDDNITPDTSKTPPLLANPFAEGAIVSVPVTAQGTGYGSSGSTTGGELLEVTVTNGGAGYTTATASASGGSGSGATFNVSVVAGAVNQVIIDDPGSLYESPTITITGDGAGATATATAAPVGGSSDPVTLSVTDANGSGAQLDPIIINGRIKGVRVLAGGSGYTAPAVAVSSAAGGSGATFGSATLTGDDVHPGAVGYYEQRRCFGGSTGSPQNVWTTRSGTERNMTYSIPMQDDDAITARIIAREANVVRHLVPLNDLLVLTSGGVWRASSSDGGPLAPATFSAKPQGYVGASMVQPVVTSESVLYAPARGSHIRELTYRWESQAYRANDASVLAPHLFDYEQIVQLAYSTTPHQALWAVRGDGVLLGMTYQPEHEIKAWHQHDTQGSFRSVCSVPEGNEDGVYAIARRTVNGSTVDYIERMHSRQISTVADAFFVDAGATYSGAAASTITGLWHLEGMDVVGLADGGVFEATVENGSIELDEAASTVHVGLGYNCDLQTLPLSAQAEAFSQGQNKNVSRVWLRVLQSSVIKAGPSFDRLAEHPQRAQADDLGDAPALITGTIEMAVPPSWGDDGAVCLRQALPLPLTVTALKLEVASGG